MNTIKVPRFEEKKLKIYNSALPWIKPFCNYYLKKKKDIFYIIQRVNIIIYLIIFIPLNLLNLFYCLWNEGLKNFEFITPILTKQKIHATYSIYKDISNLYDKYKKS